MDRNLLLDEAEEKKATCTGGCCIEIDCNKFLSWRGEGSNRTFWKALSTVLLVGNFGFYMYLVRETLPLALCGVVTFLKFAFEIWGQETPTWVSPGGPLTFFVVYFLGLPSVLYMFGACTVNQDLDSIPYRNVVGIVSFFSGSIFSWTYEAQRFRWKMLPEHKGKLYTEGLGKLCIHPNYFGDLFTYGGWALVTGTSCAFCIVPSMIATFSFFVCPNSDAYLAGRYGAEFEKYSRETANLIPGLRSVWLSRIVAWASAACGLWLSLSCGTQCGGM